MTEPGGDSLKQRLTRHWDHGAPTYDRVPGHGLLHDDEYLAWRRLLAAVLGDPSHAGVRRLRVLDVGTGTGSMALLAAELGHEVTGVDLSAAMLERARAKAAAAGLAVDWCLADAEALPGELRGFDVVLGRHVLWTMPEPERAVASWAGALRPGGLLAVIDGVLPAAPLPVALAGRIAGLVARWAARDDPAADHAYPAELLARLPLARRPDPSAAVDVVRRSGLEHVRVRPLPEVDRIERAHRPPIERLAERWRHYLLTARTPVGPAAPAPANGS